MAQQGETSVEKPQMPYETVKALLALAGRDVLEDRAFGDSEGGWWKDGREIASFYFGRSCKHVSIGETSEFATTVFEGDEALDLKYLGTVIRADYNDQGRPE